MPQRAIQPYTGRTTSISTLSLDFSEQLQFKRPTVFGSDQEKSAYIRNRIEQTRLSKVINHINTERDVISKSFQREAQVIKSRSVSLLSRASQSSYSFQSDNPRSPNARRPFSAYSFKDGNKKRRNRKLRPASAPACSNNNHTIESKRRYSNQFPKTKPQMTPPVTKITIVTPQAGRKECWSVAKPDLVPDATGSDVITQMSTLPKDHLLSASDDSQSEGHINANSIVVDSRSPSPDPRVLMGSQPERTKQKLFQTKRPPSICNSSNAFVRHQSSLDYIRKTSPCSYQKDSDNCQKSPNKQNVLATKLDNYTSNLNLDSNKIVCNRDTKFTKQANSNSTKSNNVTRKNTGRRNSFNAPTINIQLGERPHENHEKLMVFGSTSPASTRRCHDIKTTETSNSNVQGTQKYHANKKYVPASKKTKKSTPRQKEYHSLGFLTLDFDQSEPTTCERRSKGLKTSVGPKTKDCVQLGRTKGTMDRGSKLVGKQLNARKPLKKPIKQDERQEMKGRTEIEEYPCIMYEEKVMDYLRRMEEANAPCFLDWSLEDLDTDLQT